jgi:hypothetical protein
VLEQVGEVVKRREGFEFLEAVTCEGFLAP